MGMYTSLRVRAYIKPEYIEMVKEIVNREYQWNDFNYPFLDVFKKFNRASFIPFGAISYCDWAQINDFDSFTGLWDFSCSLKNYEGEIEMFLEDILPQISITAIAERLYEEESVSSLHCVRDGVRVTVRESKLEDY